MNTVIITKDKSKRRKVRWSVVAANGEIIGASSQGFTRTATCRKNMELLVKALNEYLARDCQGLK